MEVVQCSPIPTKSRQKILACHTFIMFRLSIPWLVTAVQHQRSLDANLCSILQCVGISNCTSSLRAATDIISYNQAYDIDVRHRAMSLCCFPRSIFHVVHISQMNVPWMNKAGAKGPAQATLAALTLFRPRYWYLLFVHDSDRI